MTQNLLSTDSKISTFIIISASCRLHLCFYFIKFSLTVVNIFVVDFYFGNSVAEDFTCRWSWVSQKYL